MNSQKSSREELRKQIEKAYSLEELHRLAFDLSINFDNLSGTTLSDKIVSLIVFGCHHNKLWQLKEKLKADRSREDWDEINWKEICLEQPVPVSTTVPPYQGLNFFDVDDSDRYFGRDKLINEIVTRIHRENLSFLAIVGASGSGKSSLVRAGLVPALTNQQNASVKYGLPLRRDNWLVRLIRPGTQPLTELATELVPADQPVDAVFKMIDELADNERSLDIHVKRLLKNQKKDRLLLVVDQFEELFTQTFDPNHREAFINNLMHVVQAGSSHEILVLITLRADFYKFCAENEYLREAVEKYQKYIGRMKKLELFEVIEKPINGQLQPGLTQRIYGDLSHDAGILPLLSHALLETWKHSQPDILSIDSYEAVGGVGRAIAQTAESFYQELTPTEKEQMQELMLRLTTVGNEMEDTRRRVFIQDLEDHFGSKSGIRNLILKLSDTRLVTTDRKLFTKVEDDKETERFAETVQVTHEAIIRNWKRLEGWLNKNRDFLSWYQEFSNEVTRWQESNGSTDLLQRGLPLRETQEWLSKRESDFTPNDKDFILQSVSRERRLRRINISAITLLIILTLAAGISAITLAQRNLELQASSSQVFNALSVIDIPYLNRAAQDTRYERMLFNRLYMLEQTSIDSVKMLARLDSITEDLSNGNTLFWTFSPDGKWVAYGRNPDRTVFVWEWQADNSPIELGQRRRSQNIWWLTFSADSQLFATSGSSPGSVEIWEMDNLTQPKYILEGLEHRIAQIQTIAISPNGRWVAGGGVGHVLVIWDLEDTSQVGTRLLASEGDALEIISSQFSTSGRWLGARNEEGQSFLWEYKDEEWQRIDVYE